MENADVVPLRLITGQTRLYVNLSGEAKEVVVWAAASKVTGQVRAGPEQAPGQEILESDGTVFIKVHVEANESVVAIPGSGGIMAVRLVQV